ncbi:MAG: TraR/DksA family transcriptional regulator [Actinomycetota bacterium]|nr:TraR/DksA family transcriptional regulator [Actinomycetota bacterium]
MTRTGNSAPSRMSTADLAQAKTYLSSEFARLSAQLSTTRADTITDLGSSPAGGDPADVGDRMSRTEHEAVVLANEQLLLQQTSTALQRIQDGTYETCESCTHPIGVARLQAFPRATMCLHCRELAEHHH